MLERIDPSAKSEQGWEAEKISARTCVEKVNALYPRPRFFVLCGDFCDAYPLPLTSMRRKQEKEFWGIFNKLDAAIPLICICGNHDIGNAPTRESVRRYKTSFGEDYFSFWVGGVAFIALNSNVFFDPTFVPELLEKQMSWLDRELVRCAASHNGPVIFQHVPWFVHDPMEESDGRFDMPNKIRNVMLDKLHSAGVRYVFSGHYHMNGGGYYKELEMVVTTAIGVQRGYDRPGVRIVRVLDDSIKHTYFPLEDVPTDVPVC